MAEQILCTSNGKRSQIKDVYVYNIVYVKNAYEGDSPRQEWKSRWRKDGRLLLPFFFLFTLHSVSFSFSLFAFDAKIRWRQCRQRRRRRRRQQRRRYQQQNNQQIKHNNLLVSYFSHCCMYPKKSLRYTLHLSLYVDSILFCLYIYIYFFRFIFDSLFFFFFVNKRMKKKMNKPMFHTVFVVFHIHTNKNRTHGLRV